MSSPASAPILHGNHRPTLRQLQLIAFVKSFRDANDVGPSIDEIAEHLSVSKPAVHNKVLSLQAKGYLRRVVGVHRSLNTTDFGREMIARHGHMLPGTAALEPDE